MYCRRDLYNLTVRDVELAAITPEKIAAAYQTIKNHGDDANADKMIDLYQKLMDHELIVAFAGHFSAGKSSMINALLGKDMLPKSPIPTSANIVKVTSGKGTARVYFHEDPPVDYKEPYDLDVIRDYCMDKNSIQKIELSASEPILPSHAALMDTPGIDAADDADRLITESSMHLADFMFYVMDYNHVQSEVNLQFLKDVQELGIPYAVIINQIDKHREEEITFLNFEKSIKQTFDQWQVTPQQIFFTSLIDTHHPLNQFSLVQERLKQIYTISESAWMKSMERSLQQIAKDHRQYLDQEADEQTREYEGLDDLFKLETKLAETLDHMQELKDKQASLEQAFRFIVDQTLKNAYMMPADLRELAKDFLESQQSQFKVGLFGSKRKTAEEKQERLRRFLEPLQKRMETNIQWKLRDKWTELLHAYDLNTSAVMDKLQKVHVNYEATDLQRLIKPGAEINGNYILHYTNDVSADMKQKWRKASQAILRVIQDAYISQTTSTYERLQEESEEWKRQLQERKQLNDVHSIWDEKRAELSKQLEHPEPKEETLAWLQEQYMLMQKPQNIQSDMHLSIASKKPTPVHVPETEVGKQVSGKYVSIERMVELLTQARSITKNVAGMEAIREDLDDKRARLENRSITVALFGAFSAGKSSFANAILGEAILPTSPNPTTAVINRIMPVSTEHPHGTVSIQFKDEETLISDIVAITDKLSPEKSSLQSLLHWVRTRQIDQSPVLHKPHRAFLSALLAGESNNSKFIGSQQSITLKDFAAFVTDETKACFIESVNLYYDCSITRQGITLVDTPGADSINARHTNVAFDYIKNADVILYVTYYNHAFSRADRDFLKQLGRVKESFELDKMFFIINAADLSANTDELKLVENYVHDQLVQMGIRHPKLFPLSSKRALENIQQKQQMDQQMHLFDVSFQSFVQTDLAHLMMASATVEVHRAETALAGYIQALNLDEQEKAERQKVLQVNRERMVQDVAHVELDYHLKQIQQKIEKQLFYTAERMAIRFHDFFKETFNPTTITESGRQAAKQLKTCLKELLDYTGYELLQEVRAVSLRVESVMREQLEAANLRWNEQLQAVDSQMVLSGMTKQEWESPSYPQALTTVDMRDFDHCLSAFKGTKAFFVKNEKEQMKESLYEVLEQDIKQYLASMQQMMDESFVQQWKQAAQIRMDRINQEITSYTDSQLRIMAETVDQSVLEEKHQLLQDILQEVQEKGD